MAIERPRLRRQALHARRRRRGRRAAHRVRAGVLRHGLSALLDHLAQRRSGEPVPDRGHSRATPRSRAARIRRSRRSSSASPPATRALMMRTDAGAAVRALPLIAGAERRRRSRACSSTSRRQTEYYVESNGVQSPTFTLTVVDLPTVDKLVLEYHFPAYTACSRASWSRAATSPRIKGTEVRAQDHADDDDARRPRAARTTTASAAADDAGRRHAHRQLQGRRAGLLPHRARRPAGREGERVAAVHDRRARRSGAVGRASASRAATRRRRRSRKCSPRCGPTTTSASSSCSCSTR